MIALADEEPTPLGGFRLNSAPVARVALGHKGERRLVELADGEPFAAASGFRDDERVVVFYEGEATEFALGVRGSGGGAVADGAILAPMPGKVIDVDVSEGETVATGQKLLTLEAMKMEHSLTAPFDGVVAELAAAPGQQVQVEALLARVEAGADEA